MGNAFKELEVPASEMTEEMIIKVRRLGPVNCADLPLANLTVVIGPNNSGKSYLARIVKSVGQAIRRFGPHRLVEIRGSTIILHRETWEEEAPDSVVSHYRKYVLEQSANQEVEIPPSVAEKFHEWFWGRFAKQLSGQLRRNFGSDLQPLKTSKRSIASISLQQGENFSVEFRLLKDGLKVGAIKTPPMFFCPGKRAEKATKSSEKQGHKHPDERSREIIFHKPNHPHDGAEAMLVAQELDMAIANSLFEQKMADVFYFPAGRTGIMQGQYEIMSSMIELMRQAGLSKLSVPELSGSFLDFLQYVVDPREKEAPVAKKLRAFEERLYSGEVGYDFEGKDKRALVLRSSGKNIPLNLMSSSVTEVAPLIAFLKHYDGEPGTIIIEEPEAHLHPKNQIVMAQIIAAIADQGHRVIITTHSDIILEELSNLYVEENRKISKDKRKSKDGGKILGIRAFHLVHEVEGYILREIARTPDGFDARDFDAVRETMYDRFVRIREEPS